jgi:O-antigen/teichoic acid export membrane protein
VSDFADIRRLLSSSALYAAAGLAQRGVGFLLIPVYTRVIEPAEYGMLEILNAFSAVFFAVLTLGLVSAINKCFHRDCSTDDERASVLGTALLLDLPVLLLGAALLWWFAAPVSQVLLGHARGGDLVAIVAASAVLYSAGTLVFATLRAQERALAFGALTVVQFVTAMALNLLFVVGFEWGVRGVLWGNLLSQAVSLPLALWAVRDVIRPAIDPRMARALLGFGLYLVPVMLAGWVMDQSDRYLLGRFRGLEEVALYGVGYKFGTIVDLAVVWPFQLAWPAFSFAVSTRPGHHETYARTLTYLSAVLAFLVLVVSLGAHGSLGVVVGQRYGAARSVVPLVCLAYALNGLHYCVSPGIHLAGRTRLLPWLAAAAAGLKVVLSLALIPPFGMMGAAWSTVAAFLLLAAGAAVLAQRFYPVRYEYGRLVRVVAAAIVVYAVTLAVQPAGPLATLAWHVGVPALGFPLVLLLFGFLDGSERTALSRVRASLGVAVWPVR